MIISSAFAAEHAAEHVAEHGAFYTEPEFWVAVGFFLVVGLLAKPVARAIAAALDMRAAKIRARLDEAARLRDEAQEALALYQRKQRDSLKEAEDIVAHARAEAERMAQQAVRELDEALKRREQQAMERIAQAEAKAMKEVRNTAVDIAIAATRQMIIQSMTPAQANALVDAAIKDLPGKLH